VNAGPETGRLADFLVDRIEVGIFAVDREFTLTLWNRFMATHSRRPAETVLGRKLFECFPELPQSWLAHKIRNVMTLRNYGFTSWEQRPYLFRFDHNRPMTGGIDAMRQSCTFLPVRAPDGSVDQVCVTVFDYTDSAVAHADLARTVQALEAEKAAQRQLIEELEHAHNQLLQSEKLASIGQLAAGVAHEINNPIGFVNSNLGTLDRYLGDLLRVIDAYQQVEAALPPEARAQVDAVKRAADLPYLQEDIGPLVKESRDGLDRVTRIVQDLKDFSRLGAADWQQADLHRCLDSTLNVVANEIKYKAELDRQYGEIPDVCCVPSQLNQVFMNLLVNAAQAIPERGRITLTTGRRGDEVFVAVRDSGAGIAPELLTRIFDPFFTTKPVGSGTGLGLSVSHGIVKRHGGRIEVASQPGAGSEFRVWLPIGGNA
jgi:signal transduction histidine kinase